MSASWHRARRARLQVAFEYSDGLGAAIVKKVQAEPEAPGGPLRWVASGKTILNNKGKPVKQYEPYFSAAGHRFEEPAEEGVTSVSYYDAIGRTIRVEAPDGTFSRVEFSPWFSASFDPNDTVRESAWYSDRAPPDPAQPLPRDMTGRPSSPRISAPPGWPRNMPIRRRSRRSTASAGKRSASPTIASGTPPARTCSAATPGGTIMPSPSRSSTRRASRCGFATPVAIE